MGLFIAAKQDMHSHALLCRDCLRQHTPMPAIYIDADACPVKDEVYKVAQRHGLMVWVVANQWMNMPNDPSIRLEVVDDGFDAADDWIAERAGASDIVITDDIPLASRCIKNNAKILTNRGQERDESSIGEALAMRELMQYMRDAGESKGGQKPMTDKDRRSFAMRLDQIVQQVI